MLVDRGGWRVDRGSHLGWVGGTPQRLFRAYVYISTDTSNKKQKGDIRYLMSKSNAILKKIMAIDCETWIYETGIMLRGTPFEIKGHEYEIDILNCGARRQCAMKGAQMGLSEVNVLRTLHGHIYGRYPQGTLYLFPTRDDVTDFSKGRFQPLIEDNPVIKKHVKNTDAANIKRVGDSMLYFRGARAGKKIGGIKATSSALKSVPVDRIVYDERDEMSDEMVDLASERISHSDVQEEFFLSTPTIPDYGIDRLYQESDQRVWMIKCGKCGKDTCLELEFPACVVVGDDGKAVRVCVHCGGEIFPRDGKWVAQYPDRSKDLVGWWISQLNSMFIDPGKVLKMFNNPPNGNITEVYNSKLGMAHIEAENRLVQGDLVACARNYPMAASVDGTPCAMGVDVGRELHVVIGYRSNKKVKDIIKVTRVSGFNDVMDLAKRFNVRCAVFDFYPETRKVREFKGDAEFAVFGCYYHDSHKGMPAWDWKNGTVKVNRTEMCDASHNAVINGEIVLPRHQILEVREYMKEMCNIAKVLEEDQETGAKEYKYRKLGPDHYRHATNYFLLACEKVGIAMKDNIDTTYLDFYQGDYGTSGRNATTGY